MSGGYGGGYLGFASPRPSTADRVGVGMAGALGLRLGLEFWDMLVLGTGVGFLNFSDSRPTSELVVDCASVDNVQTGCSNAPYRMESGVTAVTGTAEMGYQRRFRTSRRVSLVLALYAGYQFSSHLTRAVECSDCPRTKLDASAEGAYLAPLFRMTVGKMGNSALFIRSDWFMTGDLMHVTALGFEYGLP